MPVVDLHANADDCRLLSQLLQSTVTADVRVQAMGKSTFAKQLLGSASDKWVCVNQDSLGSWQKCQKVYRAELAAGRNVILDRCNFNSDQRGPWLAIAKEVGAVCAALWLDLKVDVAIQRMTARQDHEGKLNGKDGIEPLLKFHGFIKCAIDLSALHAQQMSGAALRG
jgi:AAA domain